VTKKKSEITKEEFNKTVKKLNEAAKTFPWKEERKLQIGNVRDGFEDLRLLPFDHVRYTMPDMSKYAEIVINVNPDTGELEIRCTHGVLVVRPTSGNAIAVNARWVDRTEDV